MRYRITAAVFEALEGIEMRSLAKKIKDLRISKGMRQHELAKKIGASQGSVSKWERGKDSPDRENLMRLAALEGVSVNEFMGLTDSRQIGGRRVHVVGELAAGAWLEAVAWPEQDQYEVSVALPEDLSGTPLEGYVVRGNSMNKLYPDGSIVYVTPLRSARGGASSGDIVMVMRTDSSGMVEGTVKEYVVDENGKKWLWPKSSAPEHQAPLSLDAEKQGSTLDVIITGVVVAALVFNKRK